ncbi:hypothetical protein I79_006203 [Cricetulus griseus]|uniref:Uncharacterized protein n=1 Tax=Cricetulus griseus TaxID=10029 RepID=G3H776_CRIGR|nr:hypothetical protein I79_006203 [Cricetulus griseus]
MRFPWNLKHGWVLGMEALSPAPMYRNRKLDGCGIFILLLVSNGCWSSAQPLSCISQQ